MRLFILAMVLLGAGEAVAAPPQRAYAVRELRITGEMPVAEQQRLKERVYAATELLVSEAGGVLNRAEDVERVLAERPKLVDCYDWRCHVELGDALKSSRILIIRIERTGPADRPGNWKVKALNFATDAIRLVGSRELSCDGCVAEDLVTRNVMTNAIAPLVGKKDPPLPLCHLKVDSRPSEARISLDETELGATPFDRTISPGRHTVQVEQIGFASSKVITDCPKGGESSLRLDLAPQSTGPAPPAIRDGHPPLVVGPNPATDRRPLFRALGFTGLGLAAASVAGLAAAGYYHGRPSCDATRCPYHYDETPALALTAVGVAAFSTAAAVLLWKGYQSPKRMTWVAPAVGGDRWTVQVGGSF